VRSRVRPCARVCAALPHAEVREVLRGAGAGPDKPIVLYCSQGGVLESNETYKRGWQTR
jgi:hypothetical protein